MDSEWAEVSISSPVGTALVASFTPKDGFCPISSPQAHGTGNGCDGKLADRGSKVARTLLPPPAGLVAPTPVATLAFDTHQELLWAGNEYVCSSLECCVAVSICLTCSEGPRYIILRHGYAAVHVLQGASYRRRARTPAPLQREGRDRPRPPKRPHVYPQGSRSLERHVRRHARRRFLKGRLTGAWQTRGHEGPVLHEFHLSGRLGDTRGGLPEHHVHHRSEQGRDYQAGTSAVTLDRRPADASSLRPTTTTR